MFPPKIKNDGPNNSKIQHQHSKIQHQHVRTKLKKTVPELTRENEDQCMNTIWYIKYQLSEGPLIMTQCNAPNIFTSQKHLLETSYMESIPAS